MVAQTRVCRPQESLQRELITAQGVAFDALQARRIKGKSCPERSSSIAFPDDGRRVAAGAFQATSESDLQLKWELHLVTAAQGLYIATHRGVQLGIGIASDTVRHQEGQREDAGKCEGRSLQRLEDLAK